MGRMMGLEPTASGATNQRSNQTELHPPNSNHYSKFLLFCQLVWAWS